MLRRHRASILRLGLATLVALVLAAAGATTQADARTTKRIVVSLSGQHLTAYEDGRVVVSTPVTTGRPEGPTPAGTFTVLARYAPYRFVSLNAPGHPFYYAPITANYSLRLTWTGYHIHDAWWRPSFGPGTNRSHTDALGRVRTGSLGCVNVPTGAMGRLFQWATVGTTVEIR